MQAFSFSRSEKHRFGAGKALSGVQRRHSAGGGDMPAQFQFTPAVSVAVGPGKRPYPQSCRFHSLQGREHVGLEIGLPTPFLNERFGQQVPCPVAADFMSPGLEPQQHVHLFRAERIELRHEKRGHGTVALKKGIQCVPFPYRPYVEGEADAGGAMGGWPAAQQYKRHKKNQYLIVPYQEFV